MSAPPSLEQIKEQYLNFRTQCHNLPRIPLDKFMHGDKLLPSEIWAFRDANFLTDEENDYYEEMYRILWDIEELGKKLDLYNSEIKNLERGPSPETPAPKKKRAARTKRGAGAIDELQSNNNQTSLLKN